MGNPDLLREALDESLRFIEANATVMRSIPSSSVGRRRVASSSSSSSSSSDSSTTTNSDDEDEQAWRPATREAVQQLPVHQMTKAQKGDSGHSSCSICQEEMRIGDRLMVLPCVHSFHETCLTQWLSYRG